MIAPHISMASLCLALLLTAVGQLLFRMYYVRCHKSYLAFALGTFLVVPVFSYFALLNLSLAFVYMSTAFTHVLVLGFSYVFLNEHLETKQYISMAFIVFGIVIFNF